MNDLLVTKQDTSLPAYMQDAETGTDNLSQYVRPSRVKVVQPQSSSELKDRFGVGTTILTPGGQVVAEMEFGEKGQPAEEGHPWHFVPLFFFAEWCTWNDYGLKGQGPAVLARTLDPRHEIAIKSQDPANRVEEHPDNAEFVVTHTQHLNFVVLPIDGHEVGQIPVVLSFARAEHETGVKFSTLIRMRDVPLYGAAYEARAKHRKNAKGEWYGPAISNPSEESHIPAFLSESDFAIAKKWYLEFKEHHAASTIVVDYENDERAADNDNDDKDLPY